MTAILDDLTVEAGPRAGPADPAGRMGRLRLSADEWATVDPAELADVVLADDLIGLRREMDRFEAVFARLARAAHVRGVGSAEGAASTAAWLGRHAGMRTGDARAAIDAGHTCEVLEETATAWRDGEISSGAARTILGARVDGRDEQLAACEDAFLEIARTGSLRDLRQAAGRFRAFACADGTEPGRHDGLYIFRGYDGRSILSGELSDLAAETVHTALSAFMDPPTDADTRTPAQRRADTLVRICETALAHAPDGHRAQAHVTIVVDWATLTGDGFGRGDSGFTGGPLEHGDDPFTAGPFAWSDDGHTGRNFGRGNGAFTGPIHPTDLHRALCDCTVSRVVTGPDGLPLDAGRSRRTVPPALRRAIVVRDVGCRFPGCDRPPGWCDAHQVVPWTDDGPTDLDNLILVRGHHHRTLHQPGWHTTFDGWHLHIHRPDRTEVT